MMLHGKEGFFSPILWSKNIFELCKPTAFETANFPPTSMRWLGTLCFDFLP